MTDPADPSRKKPPFPPPLPEDPALDEEEEDDAEDALVLPAQVALTEDDEDDDLVISFDETPDDDTVWEPVEDANAPDLDDPAALADVPSDDPWETTEDATGPDLEFDPSTSHDPPEDPWGPLDGAANEAIPALSALPVLPPPSAATLLLPTSHAPRSTPAPRTIPWRLPAEVLEPMTARLVVMTAPNLESSRLLVARWEWEDEEHLRFRLTDDGAEVVTRAQSPGHPVVGFRVRMAGVSVLVEAELTADRSERGLLLGRDALAGRFLVDASREDWP